MEAHSAPRPPARNGSSGAYYIEQSVSPVHSTYISVAVSAMGQKPHHDDDGHARIHAPPLPAALSKQTKAFR
jgi:hypothetical protein